MDEFNRLKVRIIRRALILLSFCVGSSLLFGRFDVALGLCLGAVVSILNFQLLARDVWHITKVSQEKASSYCRNHAIGRYALTGVFLFIAQTLEQVSFLGICIGLFMIKIAIFSSLGVKEWKRCFNQ